MRVSIYIQFLAGAIASLSLSACNGIFDTLYDDPQSDAQLEFGFIAEDKQNHTGRIYVNASDYTEWHYFDLTHKQMTTVKVGEEAPDQWDFAVHRYDAKTHQGSVLETEYTDWAALPALESFPDEAFVADEWTTQQIVTDMSQMMEGHIEYAADDYNPCLSKWLNVDKSTMPPVYTLSNKVYVIRMADGRRVALKLVDFRNSAAIKGFLTIDYLYPSNSSNS